MPLIHAGYYAIPVSSGGITWRFTRQNARRCLSMPINIFDTEYREQDYHFDAEPACFSQVFALTPHAAQESGHRGSTISGFSAARQPVQQSG